jgi:transposase
LVYPEYPTRRQNEEGCSLFHLEKHIGMNNKRILRQIVGIDVAQKELVVSLGRLDEDLTPQIYANKTLPNNEKGFISLIAWVRKNIKEEAPVLFVMEATGVYHESLAYFLDDKNWEISIVLPNKISNYFRTLEVKTITDKTASQAIAQFGLERKLDRWKRPKQVYRNLRQLTRERDQIVQERTMVKNQLHAEKSEAFPNKTSLMRIKQRIELLNKQESQIKAEIGELIKKDKEVSEAVEILSSIPGIGQLTSAIVLAETNGFELIRNKKQIASYAGLDVKEKESGTSVKGKPRISKRGNKYLRKALYLPALSAIRSDPRFKEVYTRLVSKHGIKMKAAVAVQRKLLELLYTLFNTKTKYDKAYLTKLDIMIDQ